MRHKRSKDCIVCGPFEDKSVMVEFEDSDGDYTTMCVDCLTGVFTSIDMPANVTQAWMNAWAAEVLSPHAQAVSDD